MAIRPMKRVCFVTTSPLIVNFFLVPHLLKLREKYLVSLIVNTTEEVVLKPLPGIEVIPVRIVRKISPLRDLCTLWRLRRLFSVRRFDLVHSFSPKAGLLAMLAGFLARVPVRVHTFTGQVWVTRHGVMRIILRLADKAIAGLATHVLTDSASQMEFLVGQGIVPRAKCRVLGKGSVSGVNLDKFKPDSVARGEWRDKLGIKESARVVLFLGRLTTDKGVLDLSVAFARVAQAVPQAVLLMVGPDEENLRPRIRNAAGRAADRVVFVDYTDTPEQFIAAADLLCLPSYREGFGSVIIEAGACGVPVVSTRIYGVTDAVIENQTGLLYNPGDVDGLTDSLTRILQDDALRDRLATAARRRAVTEFSQDRLTTEMVIFYDEALLG